MFKGVPKVALKYKELFELNRLKTLSVSYFYLALFIYFIYINKGDNLKSKVNIGKIVTIIKINLKIENISY
jgi:hypothetical protein